MTFSVEERIKKEGTALCDSLLATPLYEGICEWALKMMRGQTARLFLNSRRLLNIESRIVLLYIG